MVVAWSRVLVVALAAVATVLALSALPAAGSPGDVAALSAAELPSPRSFAAAITDGQFAYVFGGTDYGAAMTDEIVRFEPTTGQISVMQAHLPSPSFGMAAVWDGERYAYIFGGSVEVAEPCGPTSDRILRYEPATDTLTVLPERLPGGRSLAGAAWVDGAAYVVGGSSGYYYCGDLGLDLDPGYADVLRFRPGSPVETAATLPGRLTHAATLAVGDQVVILGGVWSLHGQPAGASAEVYALQPGNGDLTHVATMPWGVGFPSAVLTPHGIQAYADHLYPTMTSQITEPGGIISWSGAQGGAEASFAGVYGTSSVLIDGCHYVFGHPAVGEEEYAGVVAFSGILVYGPPPCFPSVEPSFTWVQAECTSDVTLVDTSLVTMDSIIARHWTLDDATVVQGPVVSQALAPGTHSIALVVETLSGLSALTTGTVTVAINGCITGTVWIGEGPGMASPTPLSASPGDADGDGIPDSADNCAGAQNRGQSDADGNGIGDACDGAFASAVLDDGKGNDASQAPDSDLDGIPDLADNCPSIPNRGQEDMDLDLLGDVCDADADGDGILDASPAGLHADNCPGVRNADQADRDEDGRGDACDVFDDRPFPATRNEPPINPAAGVATGTDYGPWSLLVILAAFLLLLWRYWIVLPILILFSRLAPSALLEHPRRQRILDLVAAQPGIGFEELARRTGFARGAVRHHLQVLLSAGLVRRASDGKRAGYRLPDAAAGAHHRLLASAGAQRLMAVLKMTPGLSVAGAAIASGLGKASAAHHVRRFAAAGLVRIRREGRSHRIEVVAPSEAGDPAATAATSTTLYPGWSSTQP